jgi:hypothetical protein
VSVTFSVEVTNEELVKWEVKNHETNESFLYDSYSEAELGWICLEANPSAWSIGYFYPNHSDMLDVNVANSNAREILELLGLPSDDLAGSVTSEELVERCIVARAFCENIAVPESIVIGAKGAKIINMGRSADYLSVRISALETLALANLGSNIQWS